MTATEEQSVEPVAEPRTVPVFFLSDSTGISAETMGNALLIQFPELRFERRLIPFITTVEEARRVVDVLRVGEGDAEQHVVAGAGVVGVEADLLHVEDLTRQQHLEALVRHASDGEELAREAGAGGQWTEEEEIVDQAIVVRHLTSDAPVEEPDLGPDFPLPCALVAQVGVAECDVVAEAGTSGEGKLGVRDKL